MWWCSSRTRRELRYSPTNSAIEPSESPDSARAAVFANELGDRAVGVGGDHNNDADVAAAIVAAQQLGIFTVNVNVAGVAIHAPATVTPDGKPHDMQVFRDMIELHLMGPFNLSRLCAAAFAGNDPDEDGQRGVIVNTASTAAFDGQARQSAYSAAKAGIVGMTLAMARDLAAIGVRTCSIAPGPFGTPRLAGATEAVQSRLVADVAFPKRFGKPEEYAGMVEAILRTPFLNGQTICLDGAMSTSLNAIG